MIYAYHDLETKGTCHFNHDIELGITPAVSQLAIGVINVLGIFIYRLRGTVDCTTGCVGGEKKGYVVHITSAVVD